MAEGRTKGSRRDEPTRDTPDRQEQDIERLREENDRLRKLLEEYAKRIADLERQLALKQLRAPLARAPDRRRAAPASGDGVAANRGAHHRVPLPSPPVSRLRHGHPGPAAGRTRDPVRAAVDGPDCVSDGRVPHATPGRATLSRRRAADSDQSRQYSERVGRNQRGRRGAVCRTRSAPAS
jgi:hypothetical protein